VIVYVETNFLLELAMTDVITSSQRYERQFGLAPADAVVLASVLGHAASASDVPRCFISQDVKGFANPSIYDELSRHGCKLLVHFGDAVAYIRNYPRTNG
jgi:hypothetical protein